MTKLDKHYTDARLVDLYDLENSRGADTDFYVQLAQELKAQRVIDLGCGTGMLTHELAAFPDREVRGVDPSSAMLAVARRNDESNRVTWIEGDSSALGTASADLLIMTGNVAQIFLEDEEWQRTLRNIHSALASGGHLAFESRNPQARGWEEWNKEASYSKFDSPYGMVETWVEVISLEGDRVKFEGHNHFLATGETIISESELRFRSLEEITGDLIDAGFRVEQVYGDWNKGQFLSTSRPMIFIARRD